jgi:FMN reductase
MVQITAERAGSAPPQGPAELAAGRPSLLGGAPIVPAGPAVHVLGIGGSTRLGSSSETALRIAVDAVRSLGAETEVLAGPDLMLPIYAPGAAEADARARALIDRLRWADALIVSSPGYHGSMSGMVKNALDYVEELRNHSRVYCDGMAVGCIAVADGWQAAVTTLQSLRATVHALRGWPTPLGAALNNSAGAIPLFARDGTCTDEGVRNQLETIGRQVLTFTTRHRELV